MEAISGILLGFEVALDPWNILYVTLGVLIGTVVGLLPGLGPTAGIAVLLPVTYHMDPASAIIMLAGIYYGTMYGGRIPAILLNIPGDASSVITTLDGYPLARKGRAGSALGITAVGSFIGGTVAIIALTIFAPIVAQFAVRVGAPEMFMLAFGGLMMVTFIASGSPIKGLIAAGLGLAISTIGMDVISGLPRLTFGNLDLTAGISIVPLAVGLFGIGELLYNAERNARFEFKGGGIGNKFPTKSELRFTMPAIGRASVIGTGLGVIPGGGGALSSIVAYTAEKRVAKNRDQFGKGAINGLAATETADNSSSNSAFIPMLTLGLPPNPVLAVIFGALLLQNITPGPQLMTNHPDIFWGVIASMYVGNIVLLILNIPLIGLFVQILRVPSHILVPSIVLIAIAGVYSANNRLFDIVVVIAFGILGYLLKRFQFDLAPLILAFILGPIMEAEFSRSMIMSGGEFSIFFSRPGALSIFIVIVAMVAVIVTSHIRSIRKRRQLIHNI